MRRRSNVSRFASSDGCSPSSVSRCCTNRSIGVRAHADVVDGTSGRFGGTNDQCFSHFAPWRIH